MYKKVCSSGINPPECELIRKGMKISCSQCSHHVWPEHVGGLKQSQPPKEYGVVTGRAKAPQRQGKINGNCLYGLNPQTCKWIGTVPCPTCPWPAQQAPAAPAPGPTGSGPAPKRALTEDERKREVYCYHGYHRDACPYDGYPCSYCPFITK